MLNSPFMQAGAKGISKNLLKANKFTFNGIVTNLEKTVSTINQVVPLYNQIRPLISNSKTIINAFKSSKQSDSKKKKSPRHNKYTPPNIDPNIINININETPTINDKKKDSYDVFTNIDTPHKPFFNTNN